MKDNGDMTMIDMETAELFASYFEDVFAAEDTSHMPVVEDRSFDWDDADIDFSPKVVQKKLQQLREDKSPGPDGIHPKLLRKCAGVLAEPLSILFGAAFNQATLNIAS